MLTFAEKVIDFNRKLNFKGTLPEGISVMNPFAGNTDVVVTASEFYLKFYSDTRPRRLILGINPGRFGAGVTGIPFTDSVRLKEKCGLTVTGINTYETSSVFIYEMIDEYGGPARFYSDFYISAVSPLGFTIKRGNGRELNFNYYDNKKLMNSLRGFIVENLEKQLEFGILTDVCYCLGTGKNFTFLSKLNEEHNYFERIEPLEHPRFIMQYRTATKKSYIEKYLEKLNRVK